MSMFSDEGRRDVRETIARAIAHESDADEILREAVVVLYEWIAGAESVALAFVEDGRLVPGPVAGEPIEAPSSLSVPVLYDGRAVAELWVSASEQPDDADRAFGEQVAALLSPYCLVGWDTGGEAWEP